GCMFLASIYQTKFERKFKYISLTLNDISSLKKTIQKQKPFKAMIEVFLYQFTTFAKVFCAWLK
ncbi:MAG: hypothetical protein UHK60_05795, partial [Acutalibacteraceae bacterium]|nr:hypothetical protein [Acutalibacteraceae bacterium]